MLWLTSKINYFTQTGLNISFRNIVVVLTQGSLTSRLDSNIVCNSSLFGQYPRHCIAVSSKSEVFICSPILSRIRLKLAASFLLSENKKSITRFSRRYYCHIMSYHSFFLSVKRIAGDPAFSAALRQDSLTGGHRRLAKSDHTPTTLEQIGCTSILQTPF